ncbi:MAG: hypothetical protein ACREBA_01970 [Nitrosotalea sp.]
MNKKSAMESLALGIVIIIAVGLVVVSGGFISHSTSVGTKTTQNQQQTSQQLINPVQSCKASISISNETEYWNFCDSKGNSYQWSMPLSTYDYNVQRTKPISYLSLQMPDGSTRTVVDYTKFVEPDFTNVIDQVYDRAGSDGQFIYEVWHIVSQMTTYNKDITNNNLWPLEVLGRGGGDCKDLSILIASMIRSSEHTKDWKVQLVYLDFDNPTSPKTVNHMIVEVDTGTGRYTIEATAKNNGLHAWDGTNIFGWRYDV